MKIRITLLYCFLIAGLSACSVQGSEPQAFGDEELVLVPMVDDAAGSALEVELMNETSNFSRIPDTPQGYRLQAMLDALLSEDDEQLSPFVIEHYDEDFLVQVPENDHKELLRKIRKQLKQTEIEGVSSQTHEYRLELHNTENSEKWVLDVFFQPTAPYKISGVRML